MRRRTPGVIRVEEEIQTRLQAIEAYDPAWLVEVLEPMILEPRRARLQQVIGARLASVAVLFDSPYDPHNGAAVLRSCEAFGVQRLHVLEMANVPFLAAASVARGSGKWVDVHTYDKPELVVERLQATGLRLVAAHPEGELAPEDLKSIPGLALVLGNERDGIQPAVEAACEHRVRVPMRGFVESLNVSVTLAILLHEATRGRQGDLDAESRLRLYARGLYFSLAKSETVVPLLAAKANSRAFRKA